MKRLMFVVLVVFSFVVLAQEAAVMAAIDELFDSRKEVSKAQARRSIAVKALLTPEQLEQAGKVMLSFAADRRAQRLSGKSEGKPAPEALSAE